MAMSDDEFISAWYSAKCVPNVVSQITGLSLRGVYKRRSALSKRGVILHTDPSIKGASGSQNFGWQDRGRSYTKQIDVDIADGAVIVFSDAHWWPNQPKSVAHSAMLELIKALKPKAVVANGDIFDGARVSRHAPIGWADLPSVREEMEVCEENMHEIHQIAGAKRCAFYWNVGNHDQRFDRMLVSNAAEYEGVIPRLTDKFPAWELAFSLSVNNNTMIKHRYHNGIHAGYNNTLKAGRSIVTGHLHRLLVTPWGDYNGRRYGVDTGTLSDPFGPQFEYAENNPSPHTSGFAVLNYKDGLLLPPELCEVINGKAYFRGQEVC